MDFEQGRLYFEDEEFPFSKVGAIAQELLLMDGLENWVRVKMAAAANE